MRNDLRTFFVSIGGAIIGATATIAVGAFSYANKDKELDIQLVNIGLSILSGENKGTDAEPGRRFALRLLEKYANVEIPDDEFEIWAARGTLTQSPLQRLLLQEKAEELRGLLKRKSDASSFISSLQAATSGIAGGQAPLSREVKESIESDIRMKKAEIAEYQSRIIELEGEFNRLFIETQRSE